MTIQVSVSQLNSTKTDLYVSNNIKLEELREIIKEQIGINNFALFSNDNYLDSPDLNPKFIISDKYLRSLIVERNETYDYKLGFNKILDLTLVAAIRQKKDENYNHQLYFSILCHKSKLVKYFINSGFVCLDNHKSMYCNQLRCAIVEKNVEALCLLLDHGAEVNNGDFYAWQPIHWAIQQNYFEAVKALVSYNSSINKSTNNGQTPLILAASGGYAGVVKLLLSNGADYKYKNKNGVDAYIVSIERGRVHIANLITNFHKYGLCQKDYDLTASWEPLHRAAKNGDTTTVKNLLFKHMSHCRIL